jgi:hypothetical protein
MKRLLISGFAAITLFAAAANMLRSHSASADHSVAAADIMSLQTASGVNKLPVEEFEDMSLIYSRAPKH